MGIFKNRAPSERQVAEKKLKKSGIPEPQPRPGHEGRSARYIVRDSRGRAGMDRWGSARVISPGGRTRQQETEEEENRIMREDWKK